MRYSHIIRNIVKIANKIHYIGFLKFVIKIIIQRDFMF